MPNYSLNNDAPEPDRSLVDKGFNGMGVTNPPTAYMPTVPYKGSSPLVNEVQESSDTQKSELGESASEITRRTRNG